MGSQGFKLSGLGFAGGFRNLGSGVYRSGLGWAFRVSGFGAFRFRTRGFQWLILGFGAMSWMLASSLRVQGF